MNRFIPTIPTHFRVPKSKSRYAYIVYIRTYLGKSLMLTDWHLKRGKMYVSTVYKGMSFEYKGYNPGTINILYTLEIINLGNITRIEHEGFLHEKWDFFCTSHEYRRNDSLCALDQCNHLQSPTDMWCIIKRKQSRAFAKKKNFFGVHYVTGCILFVR